MPTPKSYFDDVWSRADVLATLHAYCTANVAAALNPEELLRAEWAMRVSALDLYVHELVAQNLLAIFEGSRPICPGYSKLQVSSDVLMTIHKAGAGLVSSTTFDLEMRSRLGRITFQFPDDIADGIRMISPIELWNDIARYYGATNATLKADCQALRGTLTQIVNRRNKIVHEGDLQPGIPRAAWPISRVDVDHVTQTIIRIVTALEAIV